MSASGTRTESACRHDHTPAVGCRQVLACAMQPPPHSVRSSKLAAAQQCEAEADARCVLVYASGTWVRRPRRRRPASSSVGHICNEAAMKRRQIEQACGCSMVRGGGGLKVRAHVCLLHSDGVISSLTVVVTCNCLPLRRSRHEATTCWASLRLLHGA